MVDWDSFSEKYDEIFLENPLYIDTIRKMVEQVEDADGKRVLDLGCGSGNTTARLLERFPAAGVVAVDPSEGMQRACSRRFADNQNVLVAGGSALGIPVPDEDLDYVLTHLALHHVPREQRGQCALELARVLKRGGRLVYADIFCDVDGPPDDPERCRDVIDKIVGAALYCLEHGAYEMMLVQLGTLPADIRENGEYLATPEVWMDALREAGFVGFEVVQVPPERLGVKILSAVRGREG